MKFTFLVVAALLATTTTTTAAWIPHSLLSSSPLRTAASSPSNNISRRRPSVHSIIPPIPQRFTAFVQRRPTASATTVLLLSAASNHEDEIALTLYNSKTRQKQVFQKATTSTVSMYTCGPTVYDAAHVGNFRAFLTYDVLKRVLLFLGYRSVTHVCNITDVDDKIIARADAMQLGTGQICALTERYEGQFMNDLQALNCLPATVYPRATRHIASMIRLVQDLADRQLAYETPDGSWYFDTQKQNGYGQQLVDLNYDDMLEQKETENAEGKRHFADFCLWKAFKEGIDRDDAAWESAMFTATTTAADTDHSSSSSVTTETTTTTATTLDAMERLRLGQPQPRPHPVLQKGRPGWHLECSAMARTYFGDEEPLDFHGGGIDLKFPHHENEIAQSEGAAPGTTFCNCWFHNGFVNMGDEKMSKSLGNFITLQDACPTGLDVRAYRYLIVSSHYRNPLRFTETVMAASVKAIKRLDKVKSALEMALQDYNDSDDVFTNNSSDLVTKTVPDAMRSFEIAIADDLSMPRAAAALFSLVKAAEQELKRVANVDDDPSHRLDLAGLEAIRDAMERMDQVFGIFYQTRDEITHNEQDTAPIPDEVRVLVDQRTAAKNAKDWELADSLRNRIAELGFAVKDVKGGDPIVTRH